MFKEYFLQNEEIGAESTDSVSSGATDEPKAPAKPEEDDTVKRTLKKLREEAEAANKRAAAQIEAEKKARVDEVSATSKDAEELKEEWKHEKIVSSFSKYLKKEVAEKFAKVPDYKDLVEVTRGANGKYTIVVVESLTDRTPRFKSDGNKKTVPFTIDDLAEQIANEMPTLAESINKASGDNIPYGSGKRQTSDFNRTADPMDLVKRGLGLS